MAFPWFNCDPVEESFFDSAPVRLRAGFDVPRPAEEVWGDLTGDSALAWCRVIGRLRWTSERPFGVGTTREVDAVMGTNRLREHYFVWEEGRRHSFYVAESTAPLFRSLAEDYVVEPRGADACRFTWTIAAAPNALGRATMPMNRALLKSLFTDTARHYGMSA